VDEAGTLSSLAHVEVLINNQPPSVSLTERWWI
jgi:hypothetical protein